MGRRASFETEIDASPERVWSLLIGTDAGGHSNALSCVGVPWFLQEKIGDGTVVVGKTYKYQSDHPTFGPKPNGFKFLSIEPGQKISFRSPNEGLLRSAQYNTETTIEIEPLPNGRSKYECRTVASGLSSPLLFRPEERKLEMRSAILELKARAEGKRK
jgi:uncharacterized protein YndB with AHSA1/START domain